jgi:hypothetical protein
MPRSGRAMRGILLQLSHNRPNPAPMLAAQPSRRIIAEPLPGPLPTPKAAPDAGRPAPGAQPQQPPRVVARV